jgi:hypothetical protein
MRDGPIVEAAPKLPELEKFGHLGRVCSPLCNRFVHRRYARLNVNKEGAWRGFADRQEMRFCRTSNECGKYRG